VPNVENLGSSSAYDWWPFHQMESRKWLWSIKVCDFTSGTIPVRALCAAWLLLVGGVTGQL